jgi:hypothetical protein
MRTVAMIVSLFPLSLQAQVGHTGQKDVFAALKDSDYALRQFQDLTARNDLQRWNGDDSTRRGQLEALHAVGQNVAEARSTLSRIQRSPRSISTVDLLEVSQALDSFRGRAWGPVSRHFGVSDFEFRPVPQRPQNWPRNWPRHLTTQRPSRQGFTQFSGDSLLARKRKLRPVVPSVR